MYVKDITTNILCKILSPKVVTRHTNIVLVRSCVKDIKSLPFFIDLISFTHTNTNILKYKDYTTDLLMSIILVIRMIRYLSLNSLSTYQGLQ